MLQQLYIVGQYLSETCNFSLQYPYVIQQTGSEITQTYQVLDILIEHQILVTN